MQRAKVNDMRVSLSELYKKEHKADVPEHSVANNCIFYSEGKCNKCQEWCPSVIRYDDNNVNNVPCDLAGYVER